MDMILQHLKSKQPAMVALLRRLVECESPSTDKAAVDRAGSLVAEAVREMGGEVRIHQSRHTGNHIEARFAATSPRGTRGTANGILLLGHLDTVWGLNTLASMPFRVTTGRAYGPGIFDMKAGVVMGIFALRCLRELQMPVAREVTFLLVADEEIGSPSSRPITEKLARRSAAALVLEPSYGPRGALKTARKGVGEYLIQVQGRAAHAGLDPQKGASAITELAKQLITIQSYTDYRRGITLNPGVVRGGTRSNVVAAQAEAALDVRIGQRADAARLDRLLRGLRPSDRRTSIVVSGGMNRPPFERSAEGAELFRRAKRLARPLGIALTEAAVGGGSDGNFTAALGVPTLDGLGAVGDGAHAAHEHIVLDQLPRRTALLAHLIASLAGDV